MSKILELVLAGTPPQFDADESLATTLHVQRALGSMSGIKPVAAPYTITAADAGKYLIVSGTGAVTLNNNVLPPGAAVSISPAISASAVTVAAANGFSYGGVQRAGPLVLANDEVVTLVAQGDGLRHLVQTGGLRSSPDFDFGNNASGHFWKLPSGLVIQRGTGTNAGSAGVVVNCPYPLTGGVLFAGAIVASAAAGYICTISDLGTSSFQVHTWQNATTRGAASFSWLALTTAT